MSNNDHYHNVVGEAISINLVSMMKNLTRNMELKHFETMEY